MWKSSLGCRLPSIINKQRRRLSRELYAVTLRIDLHTSWSFLFNFWILSTFILPQQYSSSWPGFPVTLLNLVKRAFEKKWITWTENINVYTTNRCNMYCFLHKQLLLQSKIKSEGKKLFLKQNLYVWKIFGLMIPFTSLCCYKGCYYAKLHKEKKV